MKFLCRSVTIFLFYQIIIIETLQCPKGNEWSREFNDKIRYDYFDYLTLINAQCTAVITINFEYRNFDYELSAEWYTATITLRTETKFQLQTNVISTKIWYTCSMSSNCTLGFIQELIDKNLTVFNSESIQEELLNLLYISTSNSTDIQCSNKLCPLNEFCQGTLQNLIISQDSRMDINESLPCIYMSSDDAFITITEIFQPSYIQYTLMNIRCNKIECNNNKTIEEVYEIIRNNYIIPFNRSILELSTTIRPTIIIENTTTIIETTTSLPSVGSFLYSSHILISFTSVFLLFYFR